MASTSQIPHAVCVPFPARGHMNTMLKLAKILHKQVGFRITFVLTDFIYHRLARSRGRKAVRGFGRFRFASIPDSLPFPNQDAMRNIPDLCESTMKNFLDPFLNLIEKLNKEALSPVTCIISDGLMSFTLDAARKFGIPGILLWNISACALLAFTYFQKFVNGSLIKYATIIDNSTQVDWIPGLKQEILQKNFHTFMRKINLNEKMFNHLLHEISRASMASAILLNTFEVLDDSAISALKKILPQIYPIGPLSLRCQNMIAKNDRSLTSININLKKLKDNKKSINWLHSKKPLSVIYVNFGMITTITNEQLVEFAWGLANSNYDFLWVIRESDIVLPPEFMEEIKERGFITSWCVQEDILCQSAVGLFITHSGWNSMLESLCCGVPIICWPFFAEQQINCLYSCTDWGLGMEIDNNNVKREEIEGLITEMMVGEKRRIICANVLKWKSKAFDATNLLGSSTMNLGRMFVEVIFPNND